MIANAFNATVTNSNVTGATATVTFNGTQITYYAGFKNTRGIAAVSIDGGAETLIDLYVNDGTGFAAAAFTSPLLSVATHTLRVRITGTKNAASQDFIVSIDRFVVNARHADNHLAQTGRHHLRRSTCRNTTQRHGQRAGNFARTRPQRALSSPGDLTTKH